VKVSIKDLSVSMELGNNGIELDVYDASGKKHLGDLRIGKATITWSKGKASVNVVQKSWAQLIEWFQSKR